MNPIIEALRTDLVSLMGEIILANDEATAVAVLKVISAKIEAALAVVEGRS
jgi:hypothetical protein